MHIAALLLCLGAAPFSATPSAIADAYVAQQIQKHGLPGLAVVVVKNGTVVLQKGYGQASIELDVTATDQSVFQLYSTTKVFAGVAIMKLVEDGLLSPDSSVTSVMPGLPAAWKPIQVRHLLTHTSGLPESSDNPRFANLPEQKRKEMPLEESIRFVAELPVKAAPGERFSYHRSGYNLLALIVQRVSGKSFAEFLEQRVFAPLAMKATRFGDSEAVVPGRPATAYARTGGVLKNTAYSFGFGNPGAGLNSSAADLGRFLAALQNATLLKPASLEAMWQPVRLNDGTAKGHGLGWTIEKHKGRRVVGHEGGGAAWVAHFPDDRLSIAVMTNLNGARADEIQYGIADIYLGDVRESR